MLQANVLETKNSLSEFLRFLESGKEDCIVIARHNKPVAKITLYDAPAASNRIGIAKAADLYADGWDSPALNSVVASLFEEGE